MSEHLEAVLRRVAAGELTPEEALRELGESTSPPPTTAPPVVGPRTAPATNAVPVTAIRLKTSYRSIQLTTDPTVALVHVHGEHSIQQSGSTLVITTTGPLDDDEQAANAERTSPTGGRFSFQALPRTIAWARAWRDHQLTIRVNPALAVELDVTGADIKLTGLVAGLTAQLVASSLRADKLRCEMNLRSVSSSIKLTALPTGQSQIYCESSSCRLSLPAGADLTISASNRMGRLALPDLPISTFPFDDEISEVTVGKGRDRLALEAVMSSVTVSTQTWGDATA